MEQAAPRADAPDKAGPLGSPEGSTRSPRAGASSIRLLPPDRGERTAADGKWSGLLERVQSAARHVRAVQEQAYEQELHTQDLLERVRTDMQAARVQVLAAEQQVRDVQAKATQLIEAAEERARLAEDRAAANDDILLRMQKMIEAEFAIPLDAPSSPGMNVREDTFAMRSAS